jgi:uncharacterized protein (DUF885 family)
MATDDRTDGGAGDAGGVTDHPVFALSSRFVDDVAALEPMTATFLGLPGQDDRWGDLSPAGADARAELLRRTRDELAALPPADSHWAALAARVLAEDLEDGLASHEHGDHLRDLAHLASTVPSMRELCELMPIDTVEQAEALLTRIATIGDALDGWWACMEEGVRTGRTVAARQVESVAAQLRAGVTPTGAFTLRLATVAEQHPALAERAAAAATAVATASERTALRLEKDYLPHAATTEGVGEERYLRNARRFLGMDIDPAETYAWGWDLIRELTARAVDVAARIDADAGLDGVVERLQTDPAYAAPSQEAFRELMQERQERALASLSGVHFDVPDEIREVSVSLVAPGAPLAAWYMAPSEDFSRIGSIWWSLGDRTSVSLFNEVTTAYHEGFPGHHLQVGIQVALSDRLSRSHRLISWRPGYGEGWALYAEQVMDELGELERPEYVLGYLGANLMRAVRVVVDLGLHLGYRIPDDAPLHAGEPWTYDRAVDALVRLAFLGVDEARSEVTRYLGWPAQAISYAVGKREILALREERQRREGAAFDMKRFHADVLGSGSVGLDHLRELVLG